MAEVLTIGGVDRTALIWGDTLKIEQTAGEFSAVCSVKLNDVDATLSIETRDAVTVTDGATTLFAGEVVDVDTDLLDLAVDGRRLTVLCQDYQILVEEAVIDGEEVYSAQADDAIIADLFASYRADVDATTYVASLNASMDLTVADVTLRQALAEICARTGGRWYVDETKALHYFDAESNVAAWFLSDTPDLATSFPYQHIAVRLKATTIVNRVLIVGTNVRVWREDAASIAAYGTRPAVVVDTAIADTTAANERGDAILARYGYPRTSYSVTTRQKGLRAGMDVRLVCGAWGVDETLTVQRLTIRWRSNVLFYELEIGEGVATALTTGRSWMDRIAKVEAGVGTIDDTIFDVDGPAAPDLQIANLSTGVTINNDGTQLVYVVVTWGSVADTDLDQYEIQISTAADFSANVQTRLHPKDGDRSERWDGLEGNTTYYVRVRALDWVGNPSSWSTVRNITSSTDSAAPAQVTGLVAAGARSIIGLDWDDNSEADRASYEVQRDDDAAGSPSGSPATIALIRTSHYIDEGFSEAQIQASTRYHYRVRCVDTSGNEGDWSAWADDTLDPFGSDSLAALSIIAGKIAAGAVETDKLDALAVTTAKLAAGAATAEKLDVVVGGYNLLINSGFNDDDDADGVPDEWPESTTITNHVNSLDTTDKVVGASSFKLAISAGDTSGDDYWLYQDHLLAGIPLAVGDKYCFSTYIKADSLSDLRVRFYIDWRDAVPAVVQTDTSDYITSDQGWTRAYITGTVPAGAVEARVHFHVELTANNGTGTIYADAFKLERGDVPTSWTTGLIGHVTIDSNRVQVTDANAKVWLGKRGATLGLFGEDSAGDLQVYIDASDGRLYAAGGLVTLDDDGIDVEASTSGYDIQRTYKFSTSGTVRSYMYGEYSGSLNLLQLETMEAAAHNGHILINAYAPTSYQALAGLQTYINGSRTGYLVVVDPAAADPYVEIDAIPVFINDISNDFVTIGLSIDQEAADDHILAFQSSDVGHGATALAETNEWGDFYKVESTAGGMVVRGLKDGDGSPQGALQLVGYLAENVDTTKTTAGRALVEVVGSQLSGTTIGDVVADGNVFAVLGRRGSAFPTLFIVDEDGDILYDGGASSYDQEDDVALLRDLNQALARPRGAVVAAERSRSEALGIVHPDANGTMLSAKRHAALLRGAVLQLEKRVRALEGRA